MVRRILLAALLTLALTLAVPFVRHLTAWSPPPESAGRPYTALVDHYLASQEGGPSGLLGIGSRWFCTTRFLGARTNGRRVDVDVWADCEETKLAGGRVAIGTAASLPAVVHLRRVGSGLRAVGYAEPGDAAYGSDVRRLFPDGMAGWILGSGDPANVHALDAAVLRQARAAARRA